MNIDWARNETHVNCAAGLQADHCDMGIGYPRNDLLSYTLT